MSVLLFLHFPCCFNRLFLRSGSTVHFIYFFPLPPSPGQKSGQNPKQKLWSNIIFDDFCLNNRPTMCPKTAQRINQSVLSSPSEGRRILVRAILCRSSDNHSDDKAPSHHGGTRAMITGAKATGQA